MLMKAFPIAAFDFDGTISPGDSIVPFLHDAIHKKKASPFQYFRAGYGYLMQRYQPSRICMAKEHTLSFIAGKHVEELEPFCIDFVRQRLLPNVYHEAIREMDRLQKANVKVLIISASPDLYMHHLISFLPADAVLATECEIKDNVYTGRILSNCRGEEKIKRLRRYLRISTDEQFRIDRAYGDSKHDIPLLKQADKGYLVNASRKLIETNHDFCALKWR